MTKSIKISTLIQVDIKELNREKKDKVILYINKLDCYAINLFNHIFISEISNLKVFLTICLYLEKKNLDWHDDFNKNSEEYKFYLSEKLKEKKYNDLKIK